ncbi:MAG TPA: hypothetical protein VNS80_02620 [Pseudolysinimonas sp.]|nr:hypothetical protein [Pseudolysinimonas sp.]
MSALEDTQPMDVVDRGEVDGAMGAGAADAPDLATRDGGDATGGGSPGDPDAMGADDSPTPDDDAYLAQLP